MSHDKVIIYYWSGTGNTLKIAQWVYGFLKKKVSDISISSMLNAKASTIIKHGQDSLLVIAMPTHGFTAPWPVIKFCMCLPMGKKTNAVTIANGAGTYPGFYLPGFSGSANYVISFILLLKGYRIQGVLYADMPGSWPAFCPSLNKEHINHFLKKAKRKTETFIKIIFSGKKHFVNVRNAIEFVFGLALIPISFGYLLYGRFFFAKLQFANLKCNSCGICVLNCPHQAILLKGKSRSKKPYWTFKCESCGRCLSYCPQKAIETGHLMALLIWYAISLRTSLYLIESYFASPQIISFIRNKYILWVSNYLSYLLIIFLCYYILYYLLRIPFINIIFTFTSGTHWWGKYHEPSIKLQDFKSTHVDGITEDK